MKKFILLIFGASILSIVFIKYINNPKEPIYCKYADNVTSDFRRSVKAKYGMFATGDGGSFMEKINSVFLSFSTLEKEYDVDQARVLMVNCVEEYLFRINEDEKVRPYLNHFPFSSLGIEFQIAFYERSSKRVKFGYVGLVGIVNEKVYYCSYDHEKKQLVDIYEESYDESLRKVRDAGLLTYDHDLKNKSYDPFASSSNKNNVDDVNAKLRAKYNLWLHKPNNFLIWGWLKVGQLVAFVEIDERSSSNEQKRVKK